ncbi:MAG: cell division protein FtsA [Acidobacteriales bacterium]|nr:cell division protein FtsA [Terriglobales bacterium]
MSSNNGWVVGLDAGSAWTRVVICALENGELRYLGHGETPSLAWNKSRLRDQTALSESIRRAVRDAEAIAGVSVDGAVVGLGGSAVQSTGGNGLYEFGRPRDVEQGHLDATVEMAAQLQSNRYIFQVLPQDFTVDGRAGYRNPIGVRASRLEANVCLMTTTAPEHQCLVDAVHQAHLAVEETVFEGMASAYATILTEDRARGVAVMDIGAQSTELIVYDGEACVGACSLPVAGDHFSRDVAWRFTVSIEDAERIKQQYGCAVLGLTADNSLIDVPTPDGRAPREAPRRDLNEVLEARAEELFLFAREEIVAAGMEQDLLEGVVLTGGGARLNGMCDMAERVLNCQARNGLPVGIDDWPDEINDPAWTTAAGLAMYSARLKYRHAANRGAPGLLGHLLG